MPLACRPPAMRRPPHRSVGAQRGYAVTGLIGGVISSTAVTLDFSRASRRNASVGDALAVGVVGACTVLLPRITLMSAVLNASVARALIPYLLPPFVAGAIIVGTALRRPAKAAEQYLGHRGVIGSAVVLGLTDMDALTVSMNHLGSSADMVSLAARAIAIGVLTNTVFKASLAVGAGSGRFRWLALAGLALLAAASVLGLFVWR